MEMIRGENADKLALHSKHRNNMRLAKFKMQQLSSLVPLHYLINDSCPWKIKLERREEQRNKNEVMWEKKPSPKLLFNLTATCR